MKGFTDLHTHILPGVDDGAPDMTQALRMLRMAWGNGTRSVFLTPHYRGKYKQNSLEELQAEFLWLQEMVKTELPGLNLYLGQEVAYEADAPEAVFSGRVLRMNGSAYVLLEFRAQVLRSQMITGVSEMIRCGFVPIVAHFERYDISRTDPELADELLQMGALLQLNADSILGVNGFRVKRFCHKLLLEEKVHFVATDAHDLKDRPPLLRECFLRIHKKYGQAYAARLFYENAQAVIENRTIE